MPQSHSPWKLIAAYPRGLIEPSEVRFIIINVCGARDMPVELTRAVCNRTKVVPIAPLRNGTGAISAASFKILNTPMKFPSADVARLDDPQSVRPVDLLVVSVWSCCDKLGHLLCTASDVISSITSSSRRLTLIARITVCKSAMHCWATLLSSFPSVGSVFEGL